MEGVVDIFSEPLVFLVSGLLAFSIITSLSNKHIAKKSKPRPRLQKFIDKVLPYSRRIIFSLAMVWAVGVYMLGAYRYDDIEPALAFMARTYGLSALLMLFVVLSLGMLRVYFPNFVFNGLLLRASRGFGLSTFLLASLHLLSAFVGNLGANLSAITFLSTRHQLALAFSSVTFLILLAMAVTSIDRVIEWMTFRRWKVLHRFVYAATLLAVFHAFLIGSHFAEIAKPLPLVVMMAAFIYLLLEAGATYRKMRQNRRNYTAAGMNFRTAGLVMVVAAGMIASVYGLSSTYDPHAGHNMSYSDAYQITVDTTPAEFVAGQTVMLDIQVIDKSTNEPVDSFDITHEELMHLMIVSADMDQYEHLHPRHMGGGRFSVDFVPMTEGSYYLYSEFLPSGASDSLATATIRTAGSDGADSVPELAVDTDSQTTDRYVVDVELPGKLEANRMYDLRFKVKDKHSNQPVRDLEPYLGAFGHLAAIHSDKQTYLHVHPDKGATSPNDRSGPEVAFGAAFTRPGVYRLYFQFQHDGSLPVAAFTVEVR